MVRPIPPVPAYVGVTTVTQWSMTASTNTFKIVGDRSLPYVTPQYPLNGHLNYIPASATMVRRSQFVQRSRTFLGPTPYAARRSSVISWSKASYAFRRSRNTLKRTASPMAVIFWISLASRAAVPFPCLDRNPCRILWNAMADMSRRFRRLATAFQRTLTSPIPQKSPFPFIIRTTV